MEWSTRLPVIGPWVARAMRTHAWRAFLHAQRVAWDRLAAAVTFTSFIALFPLVTVGAAIGAAILTKGQLDAVIHKAGQQIPGLAGQVGIARLAANAATVGGIAGALLLLTGIGWIARLRGCLRAVWDLEPDGGNPVKRKILDAGVLAGLGGVGLASMACSAFATTAAGRTLDDLGLAHAGPGAPLLRAAGYAAAVLADFAVLVYALTLLPGVRPDRRAVVEAGLIGAVGFEILKTLMSGYLHGVAGKSVYGAFGTPVALMLWINFMAKLLMYCAAWTATGRGPGAGPAARAPRGEPAAAPGTAAGAWLGPVPGPAVSPSGGAAAPSRGWASAGVPAARRRRG